MCNECSTSASVQPLMSVPTYPTKNHATRQNQLSTRMKHKGSKNRQSANDLPKSLRILQWNTNGSGKEKQIELEKLLFEGKYDMAVIQESKLTAKKPDPKFKDYIVYRQDRCVGRSNSATDIGAGGGVITLVKRGMQHTVNTTRPTAVDDLTTDWLNITLHCEDCDIEVINLYKPPIRQAADDDRTQKFNPNALPKGKHTIICGDFNSHCPLWDPFLDEDQDGKDIYDWVNNNDFTIANTGSATRINPGDGSLSSPDITLCHVEMVNKIEWRPEPKGSSDHLPITIDISIKPVNNQSRKQHTYWNYKKANWEVYRSKIDDDLENFQIQTHGNLTKAVNFFNTALNNAAKAAIPRGNMPKFKPWWNREVKEAVQERNKLRKEMLHNPSTSQSEQWREKANLVKEKVLTSKKEEWKENVSNISATTNTNKVWRIIKSIDGRKQPGKEGASMKVREERLKTSKKKANALINQYASISRIKTGKEDRQFEKATVDKCREPCLHGEDNMCSEFSNNELEAVIRKLKLKSAPGLDEINNMMISNLPPSGKIALLKICNYSWENGEVPLVWKRAKIIPILKPGKPAENPASYRPISLTSNVAKICERLIKNRLQFWLERSGKLSNYQAGFRPIRNTEDQVLRMCQSIADGLQSKKPGKRTLLTLIDFSHAFDGVWHEGIYSKLIDLGTPKCYVKWVRAFLSDRRGHVNYEQIDSKSRSFKAGVPQGSVISPLLFIIFINDIVDKLPSNVEASLFADDLAIWASDPNITNAEEMVQNGLNEIVNWTNKWKMVINVGKCETTIFTKHKKELTYKPNLSMNGEQIPYNKTPKFLGITFDRELTFKSHMENIAKKCKSRVSIMKALSGTDWGCQREELRMIYLTYIRSCIDYCGAAWLPALSATNVNKLESIQNCAARVISGCTRGSYGNAVLHEADLLPISEKATEHAAIAVEKYKRLPDSNPTMKSAKSPIGLRKLSSVTSWREKGNEMIQGTLLKNAEREPILIPPIPPWCEPKNVIFKDCLDEFVKKSDPPDKIKNAWKKTYNSLPKPDLEVWTDGSAANSVENGGSGIFIVEQNKTTELFKPAGKLTSSFKAELVAVHTALEWINENKKTGSINIITDSKSVIQKLKSGTSSSTSEIEAAVWNLLMKITHRSGTTIILQWCPGHTDIAGNEKADSLAKKGSLENQDETPIDFKTAKTYIQREINRQYQGKHQFKKIAHEQERHLKRRYRRILAQLRTEGKCPILQSYLKLIGKATSDVCQQCKMTRDDVKHLIEECPALAKARLEHLGTQANVDDLWARPAAVIKMLTGGGRI